MKKDKHSASAVRKNDPSAMPIGDPPRSTDSSSQKLADRKIEAASTSPGCDWARYADSRLKQFCMR